MKKLCILLCILLTVLFAGCAQQPPAASETPSTTTASATTSGTVAANTDESGIGGDRYSAFEYKMETLSIAFADAMEGEEFHAYFRSVADSFKADPFAQPISNWDVVRALNFSREEFEQVNALENEFTSEEINDIYTMTRAQFAQKYALPEHLVVEDRIYPLSWLQAFPVEKWQEAGITPQMVLDKITYCRYGQGMHLDTLVYEALQTKLADYEAFLAQ